MVAHNANRWALQGLITGASLEDLVDAPFEWQPGWTYMVDDRTLSRSAAVVGRELAGQGTSGRGSGVVKLSWFGILTAGSVPASRRSVWPMISFCASRYAVNA
jgi:hypothetical protein